jgi:opacity protein-like surface antigen
MYAQLIALALLLIASSATLRAQEYTLPYNVNIGGGVGFPVGATSDFVNDGGHFEMGAGLNFGKHLGASGEFMWHDLPIKQSVLDAVGAPDASARQYSVSLNGIFRTGDASRFGFYGIGGIGWYHESGEITAPTLIPGTVCNPFWVWWGVACVNGLFPADAVLESASTDAFGENIGGGVTFRLGDSPTKFYTEIRYHHASHNDTDWNLLPLSFGVRW